MPSKSQLPASHLSKVWFNNPAKLAVFIQRIAPLSHLLTQSEWVTRFSHPSIPANLANLLPSKTAIYKAITGGLLKHSANKRISGYEMRCFLWQVISRRGHYDAIPSLYSRVEVVDLDLRRAEVFERFKDEVRDPSLVWLPLWRLLWWYYPTSGDERAAAAEILDGAILDGRIPAIKHLLSEHVYISPNHPATARFLRTRVSSFRHPPFIADLSGPSLRWPLDNPLEWRSHSLFYPGRDRPWAGVPIENNRVHSPVATHYHVDMMVRRTMEAIAVADLPKETKRRYDAKRLTDLIRAYAWDRRKAKVDPVVSPLVAAKYFPTVSLWPGGLYIPVERADAWIKEWVARREHEAQRGVWDEQAGVNGHPQNF